MWPTRPPGFLPGCGTTTRPLHPPPLRATSWPARRSTRRHTSATRLRRQIARRRTSFLPHPERIRMDFTLTTAIFVLGTITTLTRHFPAVRRPPVTVISHLQTCLMLPTPVTAAGRASSIAVQPVHLMESL